LLDSTTGLSIDYDGTAWSTDAQKYAQPDGFESAKGSSCGALKGDGKKGCKTFVCPIDASEVRRTMMIGFLLVGILLCVKRFF
jgi:hypothetical protein